MRLFTHNGHDWSDRSPLIAAAALRNRNTSFVVDGEAVLLGVDGRSDFNGLHSRRYDDEVQFYAFDTSPQTAAIDAQNPSFGVRTRRSPDLSISIRLTHNRPSARPIKVDPRSETHRQAGKDPLHRAAGSGEF